jgi:pimeloyl-ACP methyl ester carboxylesterase
MPSVKANGLNFHVNRFRTGPPGDRPVVVCVHGLAVVDNAASSFLIGFHLARDADVIAYDLRGHGRTDRPPQGYGISDHVADLAALLDALEVDVPVHLIGCSYGGAIVMAAALQHPERIASVILLDGLVPAPGWEDDLYEEVGNFETWYDEARSHGVTEDEMEAAVAERVMEEYGATRRRAIAVTKRVHLLFDHTSVRDDMRNEIAFPREDFRAVECPVLGVYGDKARIYRLIDELPRLCRNVTTHTVPGADHLDVFWRIREYRHVIRDFLGLPAVPATPAT